MRFEFDSRPRSRDNSVLQVKSNLRLLRITSFRPKGVSQPRKDSFLLKCHDNHPEGTKQMQAQKKSELSIQMGLNIRFRIYRNGVVVPFPPIISWRGKCPAPFWLSMSHHCYILVIPAVNFGYVINHFNIGTAMYFKLYFSISLSIY